MKQDQDAPAVQDGLSSLRDEVASASSPKASIPSAPHRVQLSRRKGWRMPPNTVSVARPGRYGNPFRILNEEGWPLIEGPDGRCFNEKATETSQGTTWLNCHARAVELFRERAVDGLPSLAPLSGKNLACWCALDRPCHADVLLELANAQAIEAQRAETLGSVHESAVPQECAQGDLA